MTTEIMQNGDVSAVIQRAYEIAEAVGEEVAEILERAGQLSDKDARGLYRKVVEVMKAGAARRGDAKTQAALAQDVEEIVENMMEARRRRNRGTAGETPDSLGAATEEGATAGVSPSVSSWPFVKPTQVFHGRRVALYERTVWTRDLPLWAENERLDVHIEQFEALNGREPTQQEILEILHGTLVLPGVDAGNEAEDPDDPFEIRDLANNIAKNGLLRPPILDKNGRTLLDGNRRLAACHLLLQGDKYTNEQKKRAESVVVWQLTEAADADDREAIIVALNFEDDCKVKWPDYVRAKKLKLEYDSAIARIGQRNLDKKKELKIRKDLASKYALKLRRVSLLLNMMDWVEKFEAYHIDQMGRDRHEVAHFAKNKFSYFKELYDVREVLDKDDEYRALVFDLLYQGKVKNWEVVRHFRYHTDELEADLRKARLEPDDKVGRENVYSATREAYQRYRDGRASANLADKIDEFVTYFGKVNHKSYLDEEKVATEDLVTLKTLCSMILKNAEEALKARGYDGGDRTG